MRLLVLTSLFCVSTLAGCKLHSVIHSDTPKIDAASLAVMHVYKIPAKNADIPVSRFQDRQLDRLVAEALVNAPDIRSAQARVMRAEEVVKGTVSTLWPAATLNGSFNQQHFSFQGVVPPPFNELVFDQARIGNLGLNFNYELDFWGKNRETLASKLGEAFASQMDLAETQLILRSKVASAYFELQNDIIQQQLAKQSVHLLKELEDIVLDRAKQGIESDIPVKTAITNTQAARLSIEDYKRREMSSRHQLAVLMGKNPFNTQIVTGQFTYKPGQLSIPKVMSVNILSQRPDIAASCALADSAAHQINVARAAFFPDINLSGILSMQNFYFSQLFHVDLQTEGVKAALSLPIFDAGARKANLGIKHANYELAVNQYNQTILNALQQVSDQMSALQTLGKQIQDQGKAVRTTESNYKLFRANYAAGITDYVQLIEIKQVLVQQKALLYSLQTRRKQAFVGLLAALGGGVKV